MVIDLVMFGRSAVIMADLQFFGMDPQFFGVDLQFFAAGLLLVYKLCIFFDAGLLSP